MSLKSSILVAATCVLGACGGSVDEAPPEDQDSALLDDTGSSGDDTTKPSTDTSTGDSITPTDVTPTDGTLPDVPPGDSVVPPTDVGTDVITPVDGACPTGLIICGGKCVDSTSDSFNCGACGTRCGTAGACVSGACVCGSGATKCGTGPAATCADITKDPLNCSACGRRCSSFGTCAGSACSCPAGTAVCTTGGGPGGGTSGCTDTNADPNHCGTTGCGVACGNRLYCDGTGKCACKPGLTACAVGGTPGTTCLNTAGSPLGCGACGTTCTATQVCISGVCQPTATACPTGTTRCAVAGGLAGCYDTAKDNSHCGTCGTECNQDELCIAGTCRAYTPAPSCTTCPCADCGTFFSAGATTAICCPKLTGQKSPICVRGPACPG